MQKFKTDQLSVGIIGLGYVGLPLIVAIATKYRAIGYDLNSKRIKELQAGNDKTGEVNFNKIKHEHLPEFTDNLNNLKECNFYIVTVPTPIDKNKNPDLNLLILACKSIASLLSFGDIIVFESTVFPGATEEVCVPILEEYSGLKFNKDFSVGYSPERINPGDKNRLVTDIVKITSGSNDRASLIIQEFYKSFISAGIHSAPSIMVAEAAKIIENIQRDVNIALINELALLFKKLDLDTNTVLDAACTKWNFLNFRPGLVGGHCIGVDPYYLTHKAISVGHNPELILAGRKVNDDMAKKCVNILIEHLLKKNLLTINKKILILGYTFKENCPDVRNTKVYDIVQILLSLNFEVDIFDPYVEADYIDASSFNFVKSLSDDTYVACICAVAHNEFVHLGPNYIRKKLKNNGVLFDLKSLFEINDVEIRL